MRHLFPLPRGEKRPDHERYPARDKREPRHAVIVVAGRLHAHPARIGDVLAFVSMMRYLSHTQYARRHMDVFIGPRRPEIGAEGEIDEQYVEPEETENRPGAHHEEG